MNVDSRRMVQGVMDEEECLQQASRRIFEKMIETASGVETKTKVSGYVQAMHIYVRGPLR